MYIERLDLIIPGNPHPLCKRTYVGDIQPTTTSLILDLLTLILKSKSNLTQFWMEKGRIKEHQIQKFPIYNNSLSKLKLNTHVYIYR